VYYREQINNEVKALDCKSRPVDFRVHIGDAILRERERRLELYAHFITTYGYTMCKANM